MADNKHSSFLLKNLTRFFMGAAVLGLAFKSDDASAQAKKPAAKKEAQASFADKKEDAFETPAAPRAMHVQLSAQNGLQTLTVASAPASFSEGQAMQMARSLVSSRTQAGILTQGDFYETEKYRLTPKMVMHHLNYRQQVNAVYDYIVGNMISQPVKATFADGDQVPAAGNKRLQMLVESVFTELRQVREQVEAARKPAVPAAKKTDTKAKNPQQGK